MYKTDAQLKLDIEAELNFDPKVKAAQIGVSVEQGVVSLLGSVDNYAQKWAAESATRRVSGVRTVAQDLTVRLLNEHKHSDSEIAQVVQRALSWDIWVPSTVSAQVQDARVTLTGDATWNYEREAAEHAVQNISGVLAIYNLISIKPQVSATQVKEKVQAALQRQAKSDAGSIVVAVSDGTVTLTGTTSSIQSSREASNAAWAAPGVTHVLDQVKVAPTY